MSKGRLVLSIVTSIFIGFICGGLVVLAMVVDFGLAHGHYFEKYFGVLAESLVIPIAAGLVGAIGFFYLIKPKKEIEEQRND